MRGAGKALAATLRIDYLEADESRMAVKHTQFMPEKERKSIQYQGIVFLPGKGPKEADNRAQRQV